MAGRSPGWRLPRPYTHWGDNGASDAMRVTPTANKRLLSVPHSSAAAGQLELGAETKTEQDSADTCDTPRPKSKSPNRSPTPTEIASRMIRNKSTGRRNSCPGSTDMASREVNKQQRVKTVKMSSALPRSIDHVFVMSAWDKYSVHCH